MAVWSRGRCQKKSRDTHARTHTHTHTHTHTVQTDTEKVAEQFGQRDGHQGLEHRVFFQRGEQTRRILQHTRMKIEAAYHTPVVMVVVV